MRRPIQVLLLPGTLCDSRLWDDQRNTIAALAYTQDVTLSGNTIDAMAEAVLGHSEHDLILVGCSLGGIVALAAHRQAPERIRGLALVSTTARPPRAEQYAQWRALAQAASQGLPELVEDLLPTLLSEDGCNPLAAATARAMAHDSGVDTYLAQLAAQHTRIDERPALARSTIPVLLIAAEQDRLCPPALHEEMAGLVPNADLIVLSACGHLSPLDQPDAVEGALRAWLPQALAA